jgi:hypothetical protein
MMIEYDDCAVHEHHFDKPQAHIFDCMSAYLTRFPFSANWSLLIRRITFLPFGRRGNLSGAWVGSLTRNRNQFENKSRCILDDFIPTRSMDQPMRWFSIARVRSSYGLKLNIVFMPMILGELQKSVCFLGGQRIIIHSNSQWGKSTSHL